MQTEKPMGTELFRQTMEWADREENEKRGELMHKVWKGTPWVVNAYTGSIANHGRYRDIMDWCREHLGAEALPIHGKPGLWHSGGATIHGWTWMGFATEEMMDKFLQRWGDGIENADAL